MNIRLLIMVTALCGSCSDNEPRMDASTEDEIHRSIARMMRAHPELDEHALRIAINAIGHNAIVYADHNSVEWDTPEELHEKYYVFVRESLDGKTAAELLELHRQIAAEPPP